MLIRNSFCAAIVLAGAVSLVGCAAANSGGGSTDVQSTSGKTTQSTCDEISQNYQAMAGTKGVSQDSLNRQENAAMQACRQAVAAGKSPNEALQAANQAGAQAAQGG